MAVWQEYVYGGKRRKEGEARASKNVQKPTDAPGAAKDEEKKLWDLPLGDAEIKACVQKIAKMRDGGYSWRDIARIGKVTPGTAWNYGNEKCKPDTGFVQLILSHAGRQCAFTLVCPTCGQNHVPDGVDCCGKPIAEIAVLAPGERVVGRGPKRKRAKRHNISLPEEVWQRVNAKREALGLSWEEYLERASATTG